jgi:hypothetical protein
MTLDLDKKEIIFNPFSFPLLTIFFLPSYLEFQLPTPLSPPPLITHKPLTNLQRKSRSTSTSNSLSKSRPTLQVRSPRSHSRTHASSKDQNMDSFHFAAQPEKETCSFIHTHIVVPKRDLTPKTKHCLSERASTAASSPFDIVR